MNINESYDGKTWLRSWWRVVKSNFAVIKETVEAIISDVDDINSKIEAQDQQIASLGAGSLSIEEQIGHINTQINNLNEVCDYKQPEDYTINCDATVNEDNTITVTNFSGSYPEITGALGDNQNIVLNVNVEGVTRSVSLNCYEETFGFVFVHKNKEYTIICSNYDGWSGYVTELATSEELSTVTQNLAEIRTLTGDNDDEIDILNKKIENVQANLSDDEKVIEDIYLQIGNGELKTSEQTIVGAINELAGYAHITPYKATVSANDDNTLTIDTPTDFLGIIAEREGYNAEVILDITMGDNKYVAYPSLISTNGEGKFGFTFTDNNKHYTLICDADDGWSGYVTEFATAEDIAALNIQMGDINTALENALNGGAS